MKNLVKNLNQDLIYDAIRDGVSQAFWQMITNATSMPCNDFFDTIQKAVESAFAGIDVEGAIKEGTKEALTR